MARTKADLIREEAERMALKATKALKKAKASNRKSEKGPGRPRKTNEEKVKGSTSPKREKKVYPGSKSSRVTKASSGSEGDCLVQILASEFGKLYEERDYFKMMWEETQDKLKTSDEKNQEALRKLKEAELKLIKEKKLSFKNEASRGRLMEQVSKFIKEREQLIQERDAMRKELGGRKMKNVGDTGENVQKFNICRTAAGGHVLVPVPPTKLVGGIFGWK